MTMSRFLRISALTLLFVLTLSARVFAASLASLTLTTAVTAQVTPQLAFIGGTPVNVPIQCNFAYGSGGTTASAWIQTSLDGGQTWIDLANCSFTTANARFAYNFSSLTPVTAEYTPTDGTLAANTSAASALIGQVMRVKYTTTGTYVGTTLTVSVDVQSLK